VSKIKNSARNVAGTDVMAVSRNVDIELKRLWDKINSISEKIDSLKVGSSSAESSGSFRFVDTGSSRHLEARFKDGWAKLPTNFELISKRDR